MKNRLNDDIAFWHWARARQAKGGTSWSSRLFGEDDLNLRANSRSGLSLIDSVGSANVTIIPSACSIFVGDTGITPAANTVLVARFAMLGALDVVIGSQTTGAMFRFARASSNWQLSWGNQEYILSAGGVNTAWHTLIIYDKRAWVLAATIPLTDASILNQIATTTPTCNNPSATWGTATKSIRINRLSDLAVYGDAAVSECYLGTIADSAITWQRKFIMSQPVFANATNYSEFAFDAIGNNHITAQSRATAPTKLFNAGAPTYLLDNGYSLYKKAGSADVHLPYLTSGVPATPPAAMLTGGYVWISDHPTNAIHNLADSLLEFAGDDWDRSDTEIFTDDARAAGTYYDASNPKRWHITELNQLAMSEWFNTDQEGKIFVKCSTNSVDSRQSLSELIGYNTRKTGDEFGYVLRYTGDYSFFFSVGYLLDPYNQVYKISAITDSEFKFNINGGLVFTEDELYAKFDSMVKLNEDEDLITTAFRFLTNNFGAGIPYTYTLGADGMLTHFNSYPNGVCSDNALVVYQFLLKYYENIRMAIKPGHTMNYIDDFAFIDMRLRCLAYKDKYVLASLEEMQADTKIFTEPLRKTTPDTDWYNTNLYSDAYHIDQITRNATLEYPNAINNLKYRMPAGSNFTFPILLDDTPRTITNTPETYGEMSYRGDGLFVATGTGVVEMPFFVVKITGTGSVEVDGVTYDLPTDETALTEVLQTYEKFYNTFEILTNTGGITAQFIVNHRRLLLYNNNTITQEITSGSISVERVRTDKPIPTAYLSVNKGEADSWSITYDDYFTTNKTFKYPLTCTIDDTHDRPTIDFFKAGTLRPEPQRYFNATANTVKTITAGTPVVDKCFASILTPKSTTFTTTLELTFTSVDGSSTYYTVDGSTPSASKTLYTAPFTISATTTVKWINIREGYADSHVNTRVITKS